FEEDIQRTHLSKGVSKRSKRTETPMKNPAYKS
ncbi:hypothetical protein A2U01_0087016, partial [Trifolium medium]|nr:hypothetical protein [Trifolium medium]